MVVNEPVSIVEPPAFKANDAVVAKEDVVANDDVPNKLPVIEPDMFNDPVTVWLSVEAFPILTPVFVTWN